MTTTGTPPYQVLDFDEQPPENRDEAIHRALGAASVCWETPEGAGVFDAERAHQIALDLADWLQRHEGEAWSVVPLLGYVTTRKMLDEVVCRLQVSGRGDLAASIALSASELTDAELDYRTVDR
jgi:hypothetical protein